MRQSTTARQQPGRVDEPPGPNYAACMRLSGAAFLSSSPRRIGGGVTCALALAMAWVSFLPVIAPVLDHHAVERQPGHGHIYPGGVPVDHEHGHENAHSHPGRSDADGAAANTNEIVFLPASEDGAEAGSYNLVLAALAVCLALLIPPFLTLRTLLQRSSLLRFFPLVETPPPQPAL